MLMQVKKRKKIPLLPAAYVDGRPVCPGCRLRDSADIVNYGMVPADTPNPFPPSEQLELDDYLSEPVPSGRFRFVAKCTRCRIKFYYLKDI